MEPCPAYSRPVLEQYLAGTLPERQALALEEHIKSCQPCHDVLRGLAGLGRGQPAQEITTDDAPPPLRRSVLERLLAALPVQPGVSPAPPALPRYEVREPLGRGGMVAVWLAFDRDLKRLVALKTLLPAEGTDGEEL